MKGLHIYCSSIVTLLKNYLANAHNEISRKIQHFFLHLNIITLPKSYTASYVILSHLFPSSITWFCTTFLVCTASETDINLISSSMIMQEFLTSPRG